jgi:hypothetical protein
LQADTDASGQHTASSSGMNYASSGIGSNIRIFMSEGKLSSWKILNIQITLQSVAVWTGLLLL